MTYMPVDLSIEDAAVSTPLSGVLVRVYDEAGKKVYGESTTSAAGVASFLLYGPARYQARAYRANTAIKNPIFLDVDPAKTNCFRTTASTIPMPASTDGRMCLCSGTFRLPSGTAAANVPIHFTPRFHPALLDGSGVLAERTSTVTDKRGWAQVQLVRNGEFEVLVEGYEDVRGPVVVPDAPMCNIADLIFEMVDKIEIPLELELREHETYELVPIILTSLGRRIDGSARGNVSWKTVDSNVVSLSVLWDKIILYGSSVGSTQLLATRAHYNVVRIPDPPLTVGMTIRVV